MVFLFDALRRVSAPKAQGDRYTSLHLYRAERSLAFEIECSFSTQVALGRGPCRPLIGNSAPRQSTSSPFSCAEPRPSFSTFSRVTRTKSVTGLAPNDSRANDSYRLSKVMNTWRHICSESVGFNAVFSRSPSERQSRDKIVNKYCHSSSSLSSVFIVPGCEAVGISADVWPIRKRKKKNK